MAMQVCRQSLYPSTLSDDRANNPALSRDAADTVYQKRPGIEHRARRRLIRLRLQRGSSHRAEV